MCYVCLGWQFSIALVLSRLAKCRAVTWPMAFLGARLFSSHRGERHVPQCSVRGWGRPQHGGDGWIRPAGQQLPWVRSSARGWLCAPETCWAWQGAAGLWLIKGITYQDASLLSPSPATVPGCFSVLASTSYIQGLSNSILLSYNEFMPT